MSILEKQVLKVNEEALIDFLRKGKTPSVRQLALKIGKFLRNADSGPTMRPRFQGFQQRWDHHATNSVFKDLQFDLEVVYEELLDQVSQQVRRAGFIELSHLSQSREIDRILALLRNLLLVAENTADSFSIVYDSFDDLSKTDLGKTNRDVVDLNEGVLLLPANDGATDRVDMSHLYDRHQWPMLVEAADTQLDPNLPPGVAPPPGKDPFHEPAVVVQNETVDQAWFGNAWSDMVNSWRQVVTTNNNNGCSIQFTVPISALEEGEITISRITVASGAVLPMDVAVFHSNDNINWLRLPGTPEFNTVNPGRTINFDFEDTRIQYVRFRLTMGEATVQSEGSFSYIFAVRGLAFYKMGRAQQAEFFSKSLRPEEYTGHIDRVALDVVDEIPDGCAIDYFVASADSDGNPRDDTWLPIRPIKLAPESGIPNVIKFTESGRATTSIMAPTTPVIHDTIKQIPFYQLTTTALENEPVYGSARLYRGENAWYRNVNRDVEVRQMRDTFVDFTVGNVQILYAIKVEQPDIGVTSLSSRGGADTQHTLLTVSSDILVSDSTMPLVPPRGVDPGADEQPNYSIYRIERIRDEMSVVDSTITLNGNAYGRLTDTNNNDVFWLDRTIRPSVTNDAGVTIDTIFYAAGEYIYTEGVDYLLETYDAASAIGTAELTGRIQRVTNSRILTGETIRVSFTLTSDITQMAQGVDGNKVHLSEDLGQVSDQYFRVSYRFVPKDPDATIAKSSVRVTSGFGEPSNEKTYTEGTDYIIDAARATITRISQVNGGAIPDDGTVYVDFSYRVTPRELDTFSTWIWVSTKEPARVEYSALDIDAEYGERISVDGVDVTNKVAWPELEYGWHQVVVRSRRPEAFTDAAIRQVATLRDRGGRPVMVIGSFFTRMVAKRVPMKQAKYLQLTKSIIPSNHDHFAILSSRHIVVNFEPGQTEEIYTYGLRSNSGTIEPGEWQEEYTLEYSYALENANPTDNVLFRALLRRSDSNNSAALTPKLHSYNLRIA